ncbi:MAG: flagellar motor protein MotB [Dinoroseobacter sp.]|nr:flagellar motor protein MotB [Dinoroseobacter sp.]
MAGDGPAPVIIKRKKVVTGEGHHGGAWKVAYADFVTAMMAFFMLMWLLNATTEKQRKGIADYFNPTIPVNRISGGGEGMFGGTNIFSEEVLARSGTGGVKDGDQSAHSQRSDREALEDLSETVSGALRQEAVSDQSLDHVAVHVTDEGLAIDIFDIEQAQVFQKNRAVLTQEGRQLLGIVANVLGRVSNAVAITGHVPVQPVVIRKNTGWELSVERALVVRRQLQRAGLEAARFHRISGKADRLALFDPPATIRNNRIRILVHGNRMKSKDIN